MARRPRTAGRKSGIARPYQSVNAPGERGRRRRCLGGLVRVPLVGGGRNHPAVDGDDNPEIVLSGLLDRVYQRLADAVILREAAALSLRRAPDCRGRIVPSRRTPGCVIAETCDGYAVRVAPMCLNRATGRRATKHLPARPLLRKPSRRYMAGARAGQCPSKNRGIATRGERGGDAIWPGLCHIACRINFSCTQVAPWYRQRPGAADA